MSIKCRVIWLWITARGKKKHNRRSLHQTSDQSTDESLSPSPGSLISPPPTSPLSSFASGWESGQGIWASKEQIHTCPDPQTLACFIYGWGLTIIFTLRGGVSVFFNVDGLFRINQNEEYHHLSFGGIIGLMGSEAARLLLCTLTFSVLVK